jgi:GTP:adenosylcobinamide-phosphate guanylyltransferase
MIVPRTMNERGWTAILLAGERPGENEFAAMHGVSAKALIPVGGEPMLGRVARTLLDAAAVQKIIILAQEPENLLAGRLAWMASEPKITTATSGDGISHSIKAIAGKPEAPFPVLIATADHALLTPEMVETFLAEAEGCDTAFALVSRATVEAAYPETRRTWLRFADGDYTGANLFALRTPASRKGLEIWAEVERDRKKVAKLFFFFGPVLAIRALTRTIALDDALARVGRRVGMKIRAIRLPFADAAVDVDKPADLELAERILRDRSAR